MEDFEEVCLNIMTDELFDDERYENDLCIGRQYAEEQRRVREARRSLVALKIGMTWMKPDAPDAEIVSAYQRHLRRLIRAGEKRARKRLKIS